MRIVRDLKKGDKLIMRDDDDFMVFCVLAELNPMPIKEVDPNRAWELESDAKVIISARVSPPEKNLP